VPELDRQPRLIHVPSAGTEPAGEPTEAAPRRTSSKAIGPGDIVEIDKKGRRFHAVVDELEQGDSGRFELRVRPLDSRVSYHHATVREVVGVWRKARRR